MTNKKPVKHRAHHPKKEKVILEDGENYGMTPSQAKAYWKKYFATHPRNGQPATLQSALKTLKNIPDAPGTAVASTPRTHRRWSLTTTAEFGRHNNYSDPHGGWSIYYFDDDGTFSVSILKKDVKTAKAEVVQYLKHVGADLRHNTIKFRIGDDM